MITKKFHVDQEKRQCTCVLVANLGVGRETFIGRAKCSPGDEFDSFRGQELAYVRALIQLKKKEILYHKMVMNWHEAGYNEYLKHKDSLAFNTKRLKELREELVELSK